MENATLSLTDLISNSFAAEQAVKTAQLSYEDKLAEIVKANGGSTFQHDGQWFQIRTRKSEDEGRTVTYLCRLKAEPKTWLKGRPKGSVNKKAKESAEPETAVEAMSTAFAAIPDAGEVPAGEPSTTVIE